MAPRKRRMPKLPATVFSVLGHLPVELVENYANGSAMGEFHARPRSVNVESDAAPETQWQTLFHEATHVALWDGGATDLLTKKQEEAVCNAMGTYLCAAVRDGYLKVPTLRRSD